MTQSPRPEEENIIKHIRNLCRLRKIKKETIDTTITGISIFLDRKKGIKQSKTEFLQISETFLD